MRNKNRKGVNFPRGYMGVMKKKKKVKIRKTPIENVIIEKKFNDAEIIL